MMISGSLTSAAHTCSRRRSPLDRPPSITTPYAASTPPTNVSCVWDMSMANKMSSISCLSGHSKRELGEGDEKQALCKHVSRAAAALHRAG